MLPGAVGVLSRWTAAGTALLMLAAAWRAPHARPAARVGPEPAPREGESTTSWAIAGLTAGAVALWLVASAWERTALPTEDVDSLAFQLPIVAGWIDSGSLWGIHQFTPLLAHGNYPHTGNVMFLAAMLPWRSEWLVGVVNPAFIAMAGVGVHAIARELGAARPQAMLAGALLVSTPAVGGAAGGAALTDSLLFAALAAGVLFLLRFERGTPRDELWLAALALGIAFGTKWYSLLAVTAVGAVWLAARLARRAPLRDTVRDGALLTGVVALVGGFWLVRNAIQSGSPVFPAEVAALGVTLFSTPFDPIRACADFNVFHYIGDGKPWSDYIWPAYRHAFVWPGVAIGAGLVVASVLAARRPPADRARDVLRGAVAALAALALLLALAYALTPTSAGGPEGKPLLAGANTRYAVPAFVVAAPLVAWALGRAGRLRILLELACAAAVVDGIDDSFSVPLRIVVLALLALAGLTAAGWLVLAVTGRLGPRGRDRARLAAAAACAIGLVAAGHARQREFSEDRYATGGGAETWIAGNAADGHRVALAGVWKETVRSPIWPAFGERIGNDVEFMGPTVEGQLREYAGRDEWAAALRRGRYDILIVGDSGSPRGCRIPGAESDDNRWAREEGLTPVARSDSLTVYRVPAARN
jgi:hypothetical protein